jgi:hypothetical protein
VRRPAAYDTSTNEAVEIAEQLCTRPFLIAWKNGNLSLPQERSTENEWRVNHPSTPGRCRRSAGTTANDRKVTHTSSASRGAGDVCARRRAGSRLTGDGLEVGLEMIALVAIGIWVIVTLVAMSACRAARRSDEAMDTDLARAAAVGRGAGVSRSPAPERALRHLDLDEAASLLGISPETLLAWEARYGFPTASPLEQRYSASEVLALRNSLEDGLSIASAVTRAREKAKRRRAPAGARFGDHRGGGLAS